MRISANNALLHNIPCLCIFNLLLSVTPALSQDYDALKGVKGLNTVFDYAHTSPEGALVIIPAIGEVSTCPRASRLSPLPLPSSSFSMTQ